MIDPETSQMYTEPGKYDEYNLGIWLTTITIPTIGYGDFFPTTTLGRFIMVFILIRFK